MYIMLAVLYVITGIVMIAWPHLTMDLLGKSIAVVMLVVGIAHIIVYFTKDHMASVLQMDLTIGVVFASFGAFMLFHSDFVSIALPFGIGILLAIGGLTKIQYAVDMSRVQIAHWKVLLFFSILMLALGAILIYNPFSDIVLIYYIAVSLILNGILDIISVLVISHRLKQIARKGGAVHVKATQADGSQVVTTDGASQYMEMNEESTQLRTLD